MRNLTKQASAFLDDTILPRDLKPAWLLNKISSPQWKVRIEQSRFEQGKWLHLATVRWDLTLPNGTLADKKYKVLVSQAKRVLLAAHNSSHDFAEERFLSSHRKLLHLLEWVILRNEEVAVPSLSQITAGEIVELVSLYQFGGATEVAGFYQRFRTKITEIIENYGENDLNHWLNLESQEKRELILNINRQVESDEPENFAKILITEPTDFLKLARIVLAREGFFDSKGHINPNLLANLINTDAQRVARAWRFLYEIRQYETASNYQFFSRPRGSARTEISAGQLSTGEKYKLPLDCKEFANCILKLSLAAGNLRDFEDSPFSDTLMMSESLSIFREGTPSSKTRTIPNEVAHRLLHKGLEWCFKSAPALIDFVESISKDFRNHSFRNIRPSPAARIDYLFKSRNFETIGTILPTSFWRVLPRQIREAEASGNEAALFSLPIYSREMGLADLIDIHISVCFSLVSIFACARLSEVYDIKDDDLICSNKRWFLRIRIRKNKTGAVRRVMLKPVPPVVALCIKSLIRLREALSGMGKGSVGEFVFFTIVRNGKLIGHPGTASLYPGIETMGEFFDLRTNGGERWRISPHELRRFYAMSFFHYGERENSLPALSWFMGHGGDIQKTWHYIKEDLNGAEVAAIEASWASVALRTESEQESVVRLSDLVLSHFGVERISVLSNEDLQEYLEVLQSKGNYTAELKPIRDGRGQRYTVLVHIKGEKVVKT